MTADKVRANFDLIASLAIDHLEDMIDAMESAAERVARGDPVEEIDTRDYQIYAAPATDEGGLDIVCIMDAGDYFEVLECAATKAGVSLEEAEELVVTLPEMEFGDDLITGSFDAWKGVSVDVKNDPLEEVLDCIGKRLKDRGVTVNCGESPGESSDEANVIFYMQAPVRRTIRDRSALRRR
ncbi:MAG TPA: hypothetical protein VN455_04295 [Methanotrichaceae archaeon]|nr:hypothetical protein [Methanotrichaceae archaeon]